MRPLPVVNSLWRVPAIVAATAVLASLSVAFSVFDSTGRLQHKCAIAWGRFAIFVGRVRVEVEGLDRIDPEVGYVFMANHLSIFDHWALLAFLPCQFRFVSKSSLFKIPFLGWHLRRAGNLPVVRTHYRKTIRSYQEAGEAIARGISYVIYPEGGRTWGEMAPFRRGSFLLPAHAAAPIVPVTIVDAQYRLPRGSLVIRPGTMKLTIHPPIAPQKYDKKDLKHLSERVRRIILSAYGEL